MKRNILVLIALFVCTYSFGQGEIDAYRYSGTELSGSARGQAMGGAFGALGGDVTGVAINPAGLGIYHSSEVVANMSVTTNNADINWAGQSNKTGTTKFSFSNLSYMGYYPINKGALQSLNFGFNFNRLKNFDRKIYGAGADMNASMTDYIAAITNSANKGAGIPRQTLGNKTFSNSSTPWLSILGWNGYLINPDPAYNDNYYVGLFPEETTNSQLHSTEKGHVDSYDFSVGSNFSDKLYLGATFAITDLSYSLVSDYDEDFALGGGYTLGNDLVTTGTGYQLKLGAIFTPIDALRLGVSYHSPTWYSLSDTYNAYVDTYYEDGDGEIADSYQESPYNAYLNYHFHTPYSWTFSAAGIIGTKAIVSVDYEIKDYASMNLKDQDGYDWNETNGYIDEDFKVASTVRAGLEYRFTSQFAGRVGFALVQTPYSTTFKNGDIQVMTSGTIPHYSIEGDAKYLTAGIGYRFTPQFYVDLAFVYRTQTDDLYAFSPIPNESVVSIPAKYKNNSYKGLVTLGYKF
jgi:long-subunit fatty acid transport protein